MSINGYFYYILVSKMYTLTPYLLTVLFRQIFQNKRMTLRSREAKNALKTLDLERLSQLMHKNAHFELVTKLLFL